MMSRFRACLWVLLCVCAMSGCARTPPEERLRQVIAATQQDLEERDAASLGTKLAGDFIGPDGMDAVALRRMAQAAFLRYRDVEVTLGPTQVELAADGRHAKVRFTAVLVGGQGTLLPDNARMYRVESGWREEAGEWELTSLRWSGSQ